MPPHVVAKVRNAAILKGIENAGWTLDEQTREAFFVKYKDEKSEATVSIWLSEKVLYFRYYEIEGEKDAEKIKELHSNQYNSKMIKLEEQIALELAKVL